VVVGLDEIADVDGVLPVAADEAAVRVAEVRGGAELFDVGEGSGCHGGGPLILGAGCPVRSADAAVDRGGPLCRITRLEHRIIRNTTFAAREDVTVLRLDMGLVEVFAMVRPAHKDALTLEDLEQGFRIVTQLLRHHSEWQPTATVSFLEGRANKLVDEEGVEPSLESVLRTMYGAGYAGDVFPAPAMFEAAPTAFFSRYPFPGSLEQMRNGSS
jgi:hypothetical protein